MMYTHIQTRTMPNGYVFSCGVYAVCDHETYYEFLSKNECTYLSSKEDNKRNDSLIGRIVAKHAIARYVMDEYRIEVSLSDIEIVSKLGERPTCVVPGGNQKIIPPRISLAHSNGHAVAVAVDAEDSHGVGIDIEPVRIWKEETLRGFLNESEYNQCMRQGEFFSHTATLFWCIKEAYLKARGTGLRTHPRDVIIHMGDIGRSEITIEIQGKIIPAQVSWTQWSGDYIISSVII